MTLLYGQSFLNNKAHPKNAQTVYMALGLWFAYSAPICLLLCGRSLWKIRGIAKVGHRTLMSLLRQRASKHWGEILRERDGFVL
jgi:hypothetical protein